jgi:hypothetical protein
LGNQTQELQQQQMLAGATEAWYSPPQVALEAFEFNRGIGTGFAALLRDESGAWWHRPYPWRSVRLSRNGKGVSRVEIAVAHLRDGKPCELDADLIEKLDAGEGRAVEDDQWVREAKAKCPAVKIKVD